MSEDFTTILRQRLQNTSMTRATIEEISSLIIYQNEEAKDESSMDQAVATLNACF